MSDVIFVKDTKVIIFTQKLVKLKNIWIQRGFYMKFSLFLHKANLESYMNTKNIIRFLTELKENNNREWFAENKDWFTEVKNDFEEICKAFILAISTFDDDIKNIEAKDCIFRIYRDIRFSHDKTPYKTHFGAFVASAGGRKSQRGGYYLHIDPAGSFVSVGVWCPPPPLLKALRQSIYDNIDEFNEIIEDSNFKNHFKQFYEQDKLKKTPTGFPKDFADAELLKLKHYLMEYKIDTDLLFSPNFINEVSEIAAIAYPLNVFLNYTVDETLIN